VTNVLLKTAQHLVGLEAKPGLTYRP